MKRLFFTLLSAVVLASPAFAIVGGPWDGNIPGNPTPINPSSINGTYQGTIKGKNLAGIMRFATSTAGTGATAPYTYTISVTGTNGVVTRTTYTVPGTITGYIVAFFEGTTASATVDVVVDLGNRKIAGVVDGAGTRALTETLTRPATATTPEVQWDVTDNIYFNGAFSANLSSNWAANSFTGKGNLLVKKVDFDGFNMQLITNPTTATPQIVTANTPIKVAGVKTSNSVAQYSGSASTPADPLIVLLTP